MALARAENLEEKKEKEQTVVKIIHKSVEPVVIATQKFYRTNPKETLELAVFFVFMLLTFIGQMLRGLPVWWYVVFAILGLRFLQIAGLKVFIKKRKR